MAGYINILTCGGKHVVNKHIILEQSYLLLKSIDVDPELLMSYFCRNFDKGLHGFMTRSFSHNHDIFGMFLLEIKVTL